MEKIFFLHFFLFGLALWSSQVSGKMEPATSPAITPPAPQIEGEDNGPTDYTGMVIIDLPTGDQNISHDGELLFGSNSDKFEFFIVLESYFDLSEDYVAQNVSESLKLLCQGSDAIINMIVKLSDAEETFPAELFVSFDSQSDSMAIKKVLRNLLEFNEHVDFIERNRRIRMFSDWELPWGLDRIDSSTAKLDNSYARQSNLNGSGVHVYVLDTGVNVKHDQFAGRVSNDFTVYEDSEDKAGHGTHVAGIIGSTDFGVAPGVVLHAIKVLGDDGGADIDELVKGLAWLATNAKKPGVINLSLGLEGNSPHLQAAIQRLIDLGLVVISAAGNSNEDACSWFPAMSLETISVGSTSTPDGQKDPRSDFSNWGSCVDVFAPGSNIPSCDASDNTAIAERSGTSMAAPHVAGLAALYLQKFPGATHAQFKQALTQTAVRNTLSNAGQGSPNRFATLAVLNESPAPANVIRPCGGRSGCVIKTGRIRGQEFQNQVAHSTEKESYHRAWLSGNGLRLRLLREDETSGQWTVVAFSTSATNSKSLEIINYVGPAGKYVFQVECQIDDAKTHAFELQYLRPIAK